MVFVWILLFFLNSNCMDLYGLWYLYEWVLFWMRWNGCVFWCYNVICGDKKLGVMILYWLNVWFVKYVYCGGWKLFSVGRKIFVMSIVFVLCWNIDWWVGNWVVLVIGVLLSVLCVWCISGWCVFSKVNLKFLCLICGLVNSECFSGCVFSVFRNG